MKGKTALITGANSGLGKATALQLAAKGARVVLICRDPSRGRVACQEITDQTGSDQIHLVLMDLSRLDSVRAGAEQILQDEPHIDILINNAAVMPSRLERTEDGFEKNFGVNYLSHFLLTNLLLDRIKASAPARIIHVSSVMHKYGSINPDTFHSRHPYFWPGPYSQSKLANLMFSMELSRHLQGTGVTSNAIHPGTIATGIARSFPLGIGNVMKLFALKPHQAAAYVVRLASDPEFEHQSGLYLNKGRIADPSEESQNLALAKNLWKLSANFCGL